MKLVKGTFGWKFPSELELTKIPRKTYIFLPKSKKKMEMNSNISFYVTRKLGIKKKSRNFKGRWITTGPEVFYGNFQGTEEYTKATLQLVRNLYNDLKNISYEDYEFSGFGNLISDNSFFSSPLNIPTLDNREYREVLGLKNKLDEELIYHIKEINQILKPFLKRSDIRIRKKSHSGFPFFEYDKAKSFLVYYGFEMADQLIKRFLAEDFKWLIQNHLFPIFTQNERLTPMKHSVTEIDGKLEFKPGKKKVVNPKYVLWQNGLEKEKPEVLADMDFTIEDNQCLGKYASHGRVVLGMNASLNCFAQVVDGMVQNALKEFDVCRIDEARNMRSVFEDKNCVFFLSWDYSSYDASNGKLILEYLFDDLLKDIVPKEWIQFLKCLRGSPQFFYSLEKGINRPIVLGELMNDSMQNGETSGFGMVASDGKYPSFIVSSFLLKEFSKISIDDIIKNTNERVHCKFMGDNAIFGFKSKHERDRFKNFVKDALAKGKIPFTLKFDDTSNFCGYFWPDNKPLMIDGSRFLESVIYSERDVSNKPNFALGFEEKLLRFMDSGNSCRNVIYRRLKEMLECFGHDIRNMAKTNPPNTSEKIFNTHNSMIQEIINNPDKLLYKYNIENFDPNLIEQFFTTVPTEWYSQYF